MYIDLETLARAIHEAFAVDRIMGENPDAMWSDHFTVNGTICVDGVLDINKLAGLVLQRLTQTPIPESRAAGTS